MAQQPDPVLVDPTLLVTGPPEGHLVLQISDGARIEQFPRTKDTEIDFVIYQNTKPLMTQLDRQRPKFLGDAFANSMGQGTWFVTLYVTKPEIVAETAREEGVGLVFTLKPGKPKKVEPRGIFTLEELLYSPPPRRPNHPPRTKLHPLYGDAQTIQFKSSTYTLASHHWKPMLGELDRGRDLTITKNPTIYDIDQYRYIFTTTRSKETKAVAMYQMGRTYETLGLYREAGYYYQSVVKQTAPYPANKLHMAQARIALAIEDWDSAQTHCKNAYETGAGELATLECIGLIARSTGYPSPSDVGRALANKTTKPMAHLLAAELLMNDHYYDEALELLRPLPQQLRGHHARVAHANLGDALFYTKDLEGARTEWRNVGPRDMIGAIVQQRQRTIHLLKSQPQQWLDSLPEFTVQSRDYSPMAAEVHYLMAQIGRVLDDPELSVRHLHILLDRHHSIAEKSDAVSMLEYTCSLRLNQLYRDKRWVDQVSFYRQCWRAELNRVLYNTEMMQNTVEAYLHLGLWQDAYELQLDINAIYTRDNEEYLEGIFPLATSLARLNKSREALEAIQYGRALPESTPVRSRLDMAEGKIHHRLGDWNKALQSFNRALRDPALAPEARLWKALTQAEMKDCKPALPAFAEFHRTSREIEDLDITRAEVLLVYARCMVNETQYEEAIQLTKEISLMTDEPLFKEMAGYTATLAAQRARTGAQPPADYTTDAFWSQLIDVQAKTQAVEDRARGKTSSLSPPPTP